MKKKVLWILNNVPDYRNVMAEELSKHVDLTVLSFDGTKLGLKNPLKRKGYKYIEIKEKKVLGFHLNAKEYFYGKNEFDVLILGFDLKHPFRLLNVFRTNRKVLFSGLIYGKSKSVFTKLLRRFWLNRAKAVLVYTDWVKNPLKKEIKPPILSFNNTYFYKKDIKILPFNMEEGKLNILWIGRFQTRKQLHILTSLASRHPGISLRLIGPGIKEAFSSTNLSNNVELLDGVYDTELEQHFEWSHVVMNPGHVGLLVMNTARYGRPIIIHNGKYHAPEIQLAIESNQLIIDFEDQNNLDSLVKEFLSDKSKLKAKGIEIAELMHERYTVEYSVQKFLEAIND